MNKPWLQNMFNPESKNIAPSGGAMPLVGEIGVDFQPGKGTFFRTLEYPVTDVENNVIGKTWMEAGFNPKTSSWVLWQKSLKQTDDMLMGGAANVMNSKALFEKTSFINAFDQMTTFETAQKSQNIEPLVNKTPGKLGGDYFRQFAWREGLMMSRSGRLYPVEDGKIFAANFFDEKDITGAREFLERIKTEQFIPVPITLPAVDWEKAYKAAQEPTDRRLNALYYNFNNDQNSHALALQIISNEPPEVLYAHIKRGFNPKIFQDDNAQHFALVKAAIDRPNIEVLSLLPEAGLSFYSRHAEETPLETVLQQRRYSHLHLMLSRDGAALANYADEKGNAPAAMAVALQDSQAFRMLYLEGLDYGHADEKGWALVHHAFQNNFLPGVYAWLDEGLPVDAPVKGTEYTGLSIARTGGHQTLVDFALKKGANPAAPDFSAVPAASDDRAATPVQKVEFDIALLNSAATNEAIERAAAEHVAKGGTLNMADAKGVSLLEICWKNVKPKAELNRRELIGAFGKLGVDSSARLDDGTTVLTRAVSGAAVDLEYLKALAALAVNVNNADANGNNVLHVLQLNASEQAGNSGNVAAVLKLFPALDLNQQNNDGFSNLGLAIRLNRSQTLKTFPSGTRADWMQTTKTGWSYLDIAFTAACGQVKVAGAPRADKIPAASDAVRGVVLTMLENAIGAGMKKDISFALNRIRPDEKTLMEALAEENAPATTLNRLIACGAKTQVQPKKMPPPLTP